MDSFARVFSLSRSDDAQQYQSADLCMVFPADRISVSPGKQLALVSGASLRVLPCAHNFATDAWLPVAPSLVREWIRLPHSLQKRCFISDSQVVMSEFLFPDCGHLVALASMWQDGDIGPAAVSALCRLFRGDAPVVNAGLIMSQLLQTRGLNDLPHAAAIEALLGNVSRHIGLAIRDELLTQQLVAAASIPSIQSIVSEFWTHGVQLVRSKPVVATNVLQVTFSESTRMYVAASEATAEPVFERYFQAHPPSQGAQLDFENLLVPFPNVSSHRDGRSSTSTSRGNTSTMLALVQLGNIDIFGTAAVRAIVQHKWQMFGLQRWVREFVVFNVGLALLVVLCLRTWQHWAPQRRGQHFVDFSVDVAVAALFCALCIRSAYRETVKFAYGISGGDGLLLSRIWSRAKIMDFWLWLNLSHIVLGLSSCILVWMQSPEALPVLAVASFLRWWGTLFYLQVRFCSPASSASCCVAMFWHADVCVCRRSTGQARTCACWWRL
jgi:hypothetical protein